MAEEDHDHAVDDYEPGFGPTLYGLMMNKPTLLVMNSACPRCSIPVSFTFTETATFLRCPACGAKIPPQEFDKA